MYELSKDLSELQKRYVSVFPYIESDLSCPAPHWFCQLDFLKFSVKKDIIGSDYDPYKGMQRDNPNYEATAYPKVYKLLDREKVYFTYSDGIHAPVNILRFENESNQHYRQLRVSIYGKGLKLYYLGYIGWLKDFIELYADTVVRADMCYDNKKPIPADVVDLKCSNTVPEDINRTYKAFGRKDGELFIRIYDKALDLSKPDQRIHSRMYPDWYRESCWRLEFKFMGRYARSMSALAWLGVVNRTGKIESKKIRKKDFLLASVMNILHFVANNSDYTIQESYNLFGEVGAFCTKKLKKLGSILALEEHSEKKDKSYVDTILDNTAFNNAFYSDSDDIDSSDD